METARPTAKRIDPETVKGWGVDRDPRNDPTYPYRIRTETGGRRMDWTRPPLQPQTVEILRSVEHNRMPAVTGTSTPPQGISGALRRIAFRYSESDWRHWLILLGADRLNMAEGVVDDLSRGKLPNIPREMGIRADWRYNRADLIRKAVILGSLAAIMLARRKEKREGARRR